MNTTRIINVNSTYDCGLFIDSEGVLNWGNDEFSNSIEGIDNSYFRIRSISSGDKIKNLMNARSLLRMDETSLQIFLKEFPRLYKAVAIVAPNFIMRYRVKRITNQLNKKIPVKYFFTRDSARKWLASNQ
ncbi:MAG: hypothetical protein N4A41_09185 [Crocinitomicaceae bacterium]|jgi:hypothetical protein|nr:hypothetical protein [Crocinitomicaceae bacterium]